ncbi:hypothetical protein V5O48_008212 [Marasmius crinis-equi]|uniref:Transmembrane protein n=1 Tax=Marasmius crinis-equi TaxID=585013 RepID=A0ABR3FEN3_9AGAR
MTFRPSDLEYPRRIIVDDTDPRIAYDSGSWSFDVSAFDNFGIFGNPYNGTMRGTNSEEAKFSFTFEGEFIQVKGAKDNRRISHSENSELDDISRLPTYMCQVDGSPIEHVNYESDIYETTNNVLCEQAHLSKGNHTLIMTIMLNDTSTQTFWLDSLEYAPLENADLSKEVLKIDASDPSITFHNDSGSWRTDGGTSKLFNYTAVPGASMSLKFNATQQDTNPASGRYYIDNTGDTKFEIRGAKLLPLTQSNLTAWYNQEVFTSEKIPAGEHEMVITYTGANTGSNLLHPLVIDYFHVTGGVRDESRDGSNTTSPDVGEAKREKSRTPVGSIVGGVLGGVVALLAIAGLLLWVWRRKQAKSGPRELYLRGSSDIIPFLVEDMVPTGHSGAPSRKGVQMYPAPDTPSTAPGTNAHQESPYTMGPGATMPPQVYNVAFGSQNFSDMRSAQSQAVSVQRRQHHDSGIRYSRVPSQIVEIPPTYTPD